ncbi:hypothetical protein [Streptomyces roseifaciens]|uniref:hypothetical protein n=1 Tax=Streptomyces roseifaciens TaxID=1488406 RepID=UPI0013657807|nr:hypothetical protein [Streptomyces roseifaciens]
MFERRHWQHAHRAPPSPHPPTTTSAACHHEDPQATPTIRQPVLDHSYAGGRGVS